MLKRLLIALSAGAVIVAVIVLQGIRTSLEVQRILEEAKLVSVEVFGMGANGEGIRESITIENTSAASDLYLLIDEYVHTDSIFRASADERTRTYYDRYTIELNNGRIVIPRFMADKALLVLSADGGKSIAYCVTGKEVLKAYIDRLMLSQGVVLNETHGDGSSVSRAPERFFCLPLPSASQPPAVHSAGGFFRFSCHETDFCYVSLVKGS